MITSAMYLSQLRKRKGPRKPQAEMPSWMPPMQTWYMGGFLLLLAYLQLITFGVAAGGSWASEWLRFTAPFTDLVGHVVPTLDAYSESLATHGFEDRVAIVRHAQAVSWVWLSLINSYMFVWIIYRWDYTKTYIETLSNLQFVYVILGGPVIFFIACLFTNHLHVRYGDESHSIYDLIQYIDSSLILNSFVIVTLFYFSFLFYLYVYLRYLRRFTISPMAETRTVA